MSILRLSVAPREHIGIIITLIDDFYQYTEHLYGKGHTRLSDPANHFYYRMSRQSGHTQAGAVLYKHYRNLETGDYQLHILDRTREVEELNRRLNGLGLQIPKTRLMQSGITTLHQMRDAPDFLRGRKQPSAVVFHDTLWRGGPAAPDVKEVISRLEESSACPPRAIFLG
ncbi:hypothetical protein 2050H1_208 [Serratia phage 2050H1]|uniref:Uncharacterized protein n=1 Tax=Serratia phage 2050H1 TaxID=2024250 RepID=A0A249Y2R0_9CAUD|nr:hypothetical protein 2050H1_208 [Serratia phage 2050H1]